LEFEDEDKLRCLTSAGVSLELIGEEFGKSKEAIRQKMLDLGLALKEKTILKEQVALNGCSTCSSSGSSSTPMSTRR
jgi:hypothetical protein